MKNAKLIPEQLAGDGGILATLVEKSKDDLIKVNEN